MEKFFGIAIHENYNKQDLKKILETGNFMAFNTIMQTLPRQRKWQYKSELDLRVGDIVEIPFGTSDLTYYGSVVEELNKSDISEGCVLKKVYNKVDKLSLIPIE